MALAALKTLGSEVVCPTFVSGWAQSFRCSDLQTVKNVAFLRLSGMSLSLTKKLKQKLSFWHMRVTLKHGFGSSKDAGLWSCLSYICFRLSPKLQVQWSSNGKKRSVSSTKWNEFMKQKLSFWHMRVTLKHGFGSSKDAGLWSCLSYICFRLSPKLQVQWSSNGKKRGVSSTKWNEFMKQKLSFWHMRVTLKHGFGSSKDAGLWSCLSYICFRLSPKLQVQWSSNGKKRGVSSTKWNEFMKQKLSFWHMRATLKHGFGSSKDAGLWSCLSYICFRLSPKLQVQWSSNGKKRIRVAFLRTCWSWVFQAETQSWCSGISASWRLHSPMSSNKSVSDICELPLKHGFGSSKDAGLWSCLSYICFRLSTHQKAQTKAEFLTYASYVETWLWQL